MSAFTSFFRPLPGRFGISTVTAEAKVGTGGTAVTNTGTIRVVLPIPFRKLQLLSVCINSQVAAISSGGVVTIQLFKRVGSTDTTLTAATSIESDFLTTATKSFKVAITAADGTATIFQAGDTLVCDVVADSTVGTAPTVAVVADLGLMA